MSATPETPEQINNQLCKAIEGTIEQRQENADRIYRALTEKFGLPVVPIDDKGTLGTPLVTVDDATKQVKRPAATGGRDFVKQQYSDPDFFLRNHLTANSMDHEQIVALENTESVIEKGVIDETIVGAGTPIEVDPRLVDVQRRKATVLDRIMTMSQAGFKAQYNIINNRTDPVGYLSEGEAVDLSQETPGDFAMPTETEDMTIHVDLVNVSDFSQRAESSLGYMDLTQTAVGQRFIAMSLQKARAIFYGDPSVGAGDQSIEDADAHPGIAKICTDSGNTIDKSTTSSNLLEDLKAELTTQVENTGLDYANAEFFVSPTFFDALENEANTVVRLAGFDDNLNFGGRQIQIKGVPVTECPNIRNYSGLSGTNFTSDNGDVFLVDRSTLQFRQLAPMSTVPLGRVGLSDRAAMFEYGTLIDKSQGEHPLYLQGYDI